MLLLEVVAEVIFEACRNMIPRRFWNKLVVIGILFVSIAIAISAFETPHEKRWIFAIPIVAVLFFGGLVLIFVFIGRRKVEKIDQKKK